MSLHQLSSLLTESNKTSTSGAGPMRSNIKLPLALAGLLVLTPTTGSYLPPELIRTKIAFEQTNTGLQIPKSQSTGTSIMELRRLSGLTTDQLARIFNVDRRSLHFWASGKRLNAKIALLCLPRRRTEIFHSIYWRRKNSIASLSF